MSVCISKLAAPIFGVTLARTCGKEEPALQAMRFRNGLLGAGCAALALLPVAASGQTITGVNVYSSGSLSASNVTIAASGPGKAAIVVRNTNPSQPTSFTGTNLQLNGVSSATGFYVYNAVTADLTDVTITIAGAATGGSHAMRLGTYSYANGYGADVTGTRITINAVANGIYVSSSSLTLNDSKITTGYYGLSVAATTSIVGSASMTNVDVTSVRTAVEAFMGAQIIWNGGKIRTTADSTSSTGNLAAVSAIGGGNGAASRISLTDVQISTTGASTPGVRAWATASEGGGQIFLVDSTVKTTGANAHGLRSQHSSLIDARNTTIETSGNGAIGVSAIQILPDLVPDYTNGATVSGTNLTVVTHGDAANGLNATALSNIAIKGGAVTTEGVGSHAAQVMTGGHISLQGVTLNALGSQSNGIQSLTANTTVSGTTYTAAVSIVGGHVASAQGYGIAADGGTVDITASATSISGAAGLLLVEDIKPDTVLNLTAKDATTLTGSAVTAVGATSNLKLLSGTTWIITGDSNVTTLLNDASNVVFSAPNGAFKTLTVHNYTGNGGSLRINTHLGADNSQTDRLMINGGTASGTTQLIVVTAGGNGAQTTADGIMVVQAINGATTAPGAFILGNRVSAGAYDYLLYQGGNAAADGDANDQNWYLRSTLEPTPVPNIRPEVPVFSAIMPLASEYGFALLDTLHERMGDTPAVLPVLAYEERVVRCKDRKSVTRCVVRVPVSSQSSQRWLPGGWARLIGERGLRGNKNFNRHGPDYAYTFGGIQMGLDLFGREAAGDGDRAGIYAAYGQIASDIKGAYGGRAGTVDMDAYTFGGYWTHRSASGWFTDAVVQGTWYAADARSVKGERAKPDGFGFLTSLEGGYAIRFGNGFALEPQAQLVYQTMSFDNVADAYARFRMGDGDSLRGRLGLRLSKTWNDAVDAAEPLLITGWLRANAWHEFLGDYKTAVSDTSQPGLYAAPYLVNASLGGTWGEIGAGVTAQVSEKMNLFASGAYNRSLDNKGREAWDGRIGISLRW